MRPRTLLLILLGLGLGLGLGRGRLPGPTAPGRALAAIPVSPATPAAASGPHPSDAASARRLPPTVRTPSTALGDAAALRVWRAAPGLGEATGSARVRLRPRAAPGGGVILAGGGRLCLPRGPARPLCVLLRVLLRARLAAAPALVHLRLSARRGRLSLLWSTALPRALGRPEWTFWLVPLRPAGPRRPRRSTSDLPAAGPRPSAGFVAQTECPTDGPTPVVLEAVSSDGPQAIQSSVSCQVSPDEPCAITMVKINRNKDDEPLVLTRKMEATLNATYKYNCPYSTLIVSYWQVFSVPSVNDLPRWYRPLDIPITKSGRAPTFLHIPPKSLTWGVYVIRFVVDVYANRNWPQASASDFMYVSIVRSDLEAVIPGGPNITIKFTDQLVLDGTGSSDPDSDNPSEGLLFSWYCTTDPKNYQGYKITVMSNSVCTPKQTNLNWKEAPGPVLTLQPGTLKGGGVYFFRMVIRKGDRKAYVDRKVHVLKGPVPTANISCIENCDAVLGISARFSLFLNCTTCSTSQDVYKWTILSSLGDEVNFDWAKHTTTGRNGAHLSIKAFALKDFPEAKFWASVHLASWSGHNVDLKHPFVINHVPETGECSINPATGVAFVTRFVIRCSNFKDENFPLTYKMVVSDLYGLGQISSVKENTLGAILYMGNESTSPPSFLPVGVLANHYAMKISVQVYDSLGAFSQATLFATVHAPTDEISAKGVLDRLFNFTMGPNSSLSTLLDSQEFLPAGYLIYIAASVLNNMKPELSLEADKARLREYLVNQTFILPNSTLVEISQVVMSVTELTQTTAGFTRMAQKLATVRIWLANRALQQSGQNDAHVHSEQIETVSTGILTTLSNILKLTVSYEVVDEPFYVLESLADTVLEGKVPGNETTAMTASSLNVYVRKTERWDVTDIFRDEKSSRNYFRPMLNVSSIPSLHENALISTMFCEFADDPFPWMNEQESCSAEVVGFRMTGTTPDGDVVEIMPDVAEVYIARKNLSFAAFNLTVGPESETGGADESLKRTTGEFRVEVDSSVVKELLVHIVTQVTVLFTVFVYAGSEITPTALVATFLVPHDIPPMTNQSDLFDSACAVREARVVCLPASLLQVIAQRGGSSECTLIIALQAPRFVMTANDKLVRIALFSAHCLDMYGIQSDWREDTCVLGERTTWLRVHCICQSTRRVRRQLDLIKQASRHLQTHFLTAIVIVLPNAVDLRLEVIKNVTHNPVTLFTVLFIMLMYIILAFWALHRDDMDQYLRQHVIILLDNDPYDKVCYLVTVFTGSRYRAGTRADVFIQLMGTEGASDVHCLSHPYFATLYRGGINTFLLTTKRDLGDIHSIRVWHNNEGKSPSWYLSRVKVENLFSRHIWLFLCREWLCIDTSLDRTLRVTDPDQPIDRKDYFLIESAYRMGRDHLWFSIFSTIIDSPFNRLQRLSCCLAVLMASLLCNIMFFNLDRPENLASGEGSYVRSMMIGLESVLITLPLQILIIFLFTYSQREPRVTLEKVSPRKTSSMELENLYWEEFLRRWYARESGDSSIKGPLEPPTGKRPRLQKTAQALSATRHQPKKKESRDSRTQATNINASNANTNNNQNVPSGEPPSHAGPTLELKEKSSFILPSWCLHIAWLLVFATSIMSSFFIIFYGLTYGYEKSMDWLFASFCSFCLSVFLVQTCKIILLSGFRSSSPKYCKNLSWESQFRYTEIELQSTLSPEEMQRRQEQIMELRRSRMYQPLTEDEILIFKRKRAIKRRAFLFLCCVLTHFIFLALLLRLVALLRHTDSSYYNQFVRDRFSVDLGSVTKLEDIYRWLSSVLVPLVHHDPNPAFLPDSSSKILGLPLLRQVRARPGEKLCLPASFAQTSMGREIHCHPSYGTDPEDTRSYSSLWNNVLKRPEDKNTNGFTYKPPEKIWGYVSHGLSHTYGSGGYAFYFFPEQQPFNSTVRLRELQSSEWLDEKTWAVILELTTFNPDVSLFCSISVVFEASQLGVVNTSLSVHSFSLADFDRETSAETYLYVAILIFFLAYVVDEGYIIMQERASYVRSVYNLLNFALKCIFTVLIVLFLRKHFLATGIIRFYLSHPEDFIPFHAVSQVDHAMRIILGFLLFLTILKTLRYSRIFYDVRLAQRAIQAALPGICHMALVVSVYFFVFMVIGSLVFGQHEWNYSNLIHGMQTIFSYCVPAFQNTEFSNNRVLGVLFLSSFVLVMICVLINLFRAVILSTYEKMKQPVYEEPSEEAEAMTYLCHKLRAMFRFLTFQPRDKDEPEFFVNMLYGQPEKNSRRYLGLKTRNIKGKKMVYLVV
ncbi:polycystic kidney disease and receptor for egg jelly-related protein-like [Lontra canadensis]|uniref:polycystic kidney disease and receptor for egg jelly-related protein-like n=1 Tax=Lontra canadensis TaxID=76717 RepID=UPI0013F3223D|nr:polycystic kidney disease and receptor for egg jelly-related protein-like [Lontra canadensis]